MRRDKKAEGFLSFIFYSIIGAIIFLVIYSFWFAPQGTSEFFDEIKEKASDTTNYVVENLKKNSAESNEIKNVRRDSSIQSCLNNVNKHIEIVKAKSLFDITTKIKEYKQFDNSYDAIDYLKEWKYIDEDLCYDDECFINVRNTFNFPTFFEREGIGKVEVIEYSDIVIVLNRVDFYTNEGKLGSLDPFICIDGELEQ